MSLRLQAMECPSKNRVRLVQVCAELDAYYARFYGFTRDELRYVLGPKEVQGEDFPRETFRVLKEKEVKQYRKCQTRRLVLEVWDVLEKEIENVADTIQVTQPATDTLEKVCVNVTTYRYNQCCSTEEH